MKMLNITIDVENEDMTGWNTEGFPLDRRDKCILDFVAPILKMKCITALSILIFISVTIFSWKTSTAEDITVTECNEKNVSAKYSICFRDEADVLVRWYRISEHDCRAKYENVARCIEWAGKHCGNGENAIYFRFMYHEYNIRIAAKYACENLDELRHVVNCVGNQGSQIYQCRRRIHYGSKYDQFYKDKNPDVAELWCWNMGISVHCRHLAARNCQYSDIYFNYLFSVYPTECQGLPWENLVEPTGKVTTISFTDKDCTLNNYLDKFHQCFSLENTFEFSKINSTERCNKKISPMRSCTDRLYKTCSHVDRLQHLVKEYANPTKMAAAHRYICDNVKDFQAGFECINQNKFYIEECKRNLLKQKLVLIRYYQKFKPEMSACIYITLDYECRKMFFHTCKNSKYYAKYLHMINPNCSAFITPPIFDRKMCEGSKYRDSFKKCIDMENTLISHPHKFGEDCQGKYFKFYECVMKLKETCKYVRNDMIAQKMADSLLPHRDTINFFCQSSVNLQLRYAGLCITSYLKEIENCVARHPLRMGAMNDACQYMDVLSECQAKYLLGARTACPSSVVYLEYRKSMVPRHCHKQQAKPQPSGCKSTHLHWRIYKCLNIQQIIKEVSLYGQNCNENVDKAWKCYNKALKDCRMESLQPLKDTWIRDTQKLVCRKYKDIYRLKSVAYCLSSYESAIEYCLSRKSVVNHPCQMLMSVSDCLTSVAKKNCAWVEYMSGFLRKTISCSVPTVTPTSGQESLATISQYYVSITTIAVIYLYKLL